MLVTASVCTKPCPPTKPGWLARHCNRMSPASSAVHPLGVPIPQQRTGLPAIVGEARRAARVEGELEGLKLGIEHQHAELAQMRREVAEAHNRAVVAEQQEIEATRQREGAEVALAKARKWNFLNFLFGLEGKRRR